MIYAEKCAEADKFGKGLPAQIIKYHSCGDWLDFDKVIIERSYAIVHGCPWVAALTLQKEVIADGISIKGAVCLEKYFATLDDAKAFAKWCPARKVTISYMHDNGRGSFPRYGYETGGAFLDKDDASHNYRFD